MYWYVHYCIQYIHSFYTRYGIEQSIFTNVIVNLLHKKFEIVVIIIYKRFKRLSLIYILFIMLNNKQYIITYNYLLGYYEIIYIFHCILYMHIIYKLE